MNTQRSNIWNYVLAMAIPTASLVVVNVGCGSTQPMRSGANVPASEGTVEATEGDNGNTKVSVHVKHLASPARVDRDATVYVVWIQAANAAKQNVGALTVDDALEGSLETVTPFREFDLMVTPEATGEAVQPTSEPVFTTRVVREE